MEYFLEDGKNGTSKKAGVNSNGQLEVYAESKSSEGSQAEQGNAFIIHAKCHLANAVSGGFLTIQNNESDYLLEVTRIYIDPHSLTDDIIIKQVFDATITNGTDVSETAVVQKNRDSNVDFDLTVTMSDGSSDMTYSGGEEYHAFPVRSLTSSQRDMNHTNVLGRGKKITFGWETADGGAAVDGEIISFSVNVVKRKK